MTYNAVKAAAISLAKSMARQLAPENIPRQQRRAGVDFVSWGNVAPPAAERSGGDGRVRQA